MGAPNAQAQLPSDVVPLHSFSDVPALPKDVPELLKRYGDVTATGGDTEKGDLATEPLRQRIDGWMKPAGPPSPGDYSTMMGAGGSMSPAAGDAIGQLVQTAATMSGDMAQAVQAFSLTTMPPLKQAYEDKLKKIFDEYNPQIERCLAMSERAGGSPCADPTPQRDAAINAAGSEFLREASGPYLDYVTKLKMIASGGETTIDRATKAFGQSTPGFAKVQITVIRQDELNDLLAALAAENDVVTYTLGHAANPKEGRGKP